MRYIIADPHFGCEKLIMNFPRYRPGTKELFDSIEEHDDYLIRDINLVARPDDELHILGDFSYDTPGKYRMRLKCKHVYLTRGNHDRPEKSRRVFGEIPRIRIIKLRGCGGKSLKTVLCHTPMAFWEGSHKGWAHLYGHCHGQREDTLDAALGPDRRSLDVSVDNIYKLTGNFMPLDEQDLYYWMISRAGHDPPAFYDNYRGMKNANN
jgi:calcineurin-like phosphoesterase family protein